MDVALPSGDESDGSDVSSLPGPDEMYGPKDSEGSDDEEDESESEEEDSEEEDSEDEEQYQ